MEEIWKDIKIENYQISNLGNVRNSLSGRLLKSRVNHNGYLRIGLGGHKQQKWFFVHRLVYETFIGPIPEGMQVNHIDENKTNNRVDNLNLMTPKENTNWGSGIRRGVRKRRKPVTQYIGNKPFFSFFSAFDAEKETGIPYQNISKCCKGERSTAGGFKWRYAS